MASDDDTDSGVSLVLADLRSMGCELRPIWSSACAGCLPRILNDASARANRWQTVGARVSALGARRSKD